ncbi:MAG: ATP phosphoribosyltransferase [Alphaproteobacteria bacterium]|nr:ATP phosphoribosyltransferase [Alphaproteobacteria bacterium]
MIEQLTIAVPKGRILDELQPMFNAIGLEPEASFYDDKSRALQFATNFSHVRIIRVRSFDVATFVAFNAAQLGICGSDVLMEYDYADIYAPLDLGIGHCRLSVAEPMDISEEYAPQRWSHARIATKYPNLSRRHFAKYGVQAECIKLNGAMELAPSLGLASRIVDLVSSGNTLKANGLKEVETILDISSRLIVNRTAFKTHSAELKSWVDKFREASRGQIAA